MPQLRASLQLTSNCLGALKYNKKSMTLLMLHLTTATWNYNAMQLHSQ